MWWSSMWSEVCRPAWQYTMQAHLQMQHIRLHLALSAHVSQLYENESMLDSHTISHLMYKYSVSRRPHAEAVSGTLDLQLLGTCKRTTGRVKKTSCWVYSQVLNFRSSNRVCGTCFKMPSYCNSK
jgi:hypothetical protein